MCVSVRDAHTGLGRGAEGDRSQRNPPPPRPSPFCLTVPPPSDASLVPWRRAPLPPPHSRGCRHNRGHERVQSSVVRCRALGHGGPRHPGPRHAGPHHRPPLQHRRGVQRPGLREAQPPDPLHEGRVRSRAHGRSRVEPHRRGTSAACPDGQVVQAAQISRWAGEGGVAGGG